MASTKLAHLRVLMDYTFTSAGNLGACWLPWWFISACKLSWASQFIWAPITEVLIQQIWGGTRTHAIVFWSQRALAQETQLCTFFPAPHSVTSCGLFKISQVGAFIPLKSANANNQESPRILPLCPRKLSVKHLPACHWTNTWLFKQPGDKWCWFC